MKKIYTEDQLKEKAKQVFADYTNAQEVHATLDGNIFLEKNRAELHAKGGRVIPFNKAIVSEAKADEPKVLNAPASIAFIKVAKTIEAIASFATDTRATVLAAYEKRVKELEVPATPEGDAPTADTLTPDNGTTPTE